MQRAALEVVLLAPLAGILGTQIVLRGLAFFTHGVGTATFPGLVVAGSVAVPAPLAALGAGALFAWIVERLGRTRAIAADAATALVLVGALALGSVLASDVFGSGSRVDQLLFGSLLAIGTEELLVTAAALAIVAVIAAAHRRSWIVTGFDPLTGHSVGLARRRGDWALVLAIAVAVVAALDAVGALLVSALLVIPAATVRPFARSLAGYELASGALALAQGMAGLWLAFELDVPPGAAIALVGGTCFAGALIAAELHRSRAPEAA